jgi:hypothetical protein
MGLDGARDGAGGTSESDQEGIAGMSRLGLSRRRASCQALTCPCFCSCTRGEVGLENQNSDGLTIKTALLFII